MRFRSRGTWYKQRRPSSIYLQVDKVGQVLKLGDPVAVNVQMCELQAVLEACYPLNFVVAEPELLQVRATLQPLNRAHTLHQDL